MNAADCLNSLPPLPPLPSFREAPPEPAALHWLGGGALVVGGGALGLSGPVLLTSRGGYEAAAVT